MSSDHNHERLETLQKNYRRAWIAYAAEVESLQLAQASGEQEPILLDAARERVERAAAEYRVARDEMALFLLDHAAIRPEFVAEGEPEPAFAVCRVA